MNFILIPTLGIIFTVAAFVLAISVLYLFVRRKNISYLAVVKAYALFALGNMVLSLLFPLSGISFLTQVIILSLITFLIFYIAMRVSLGISWKRSLAMFLVVFIFFLPVLTGFMNMTTTSLLSIPALEQERPIYADSFVVKIGTFEGPLTEHPNLYMTGADMINRAVSNWQIDYLYSLFVSSRL